MDLSGLFLKPEAGALCRFPLSSAAVHGRDVHGRIQGNYLPPLFFLVLPMALKSRLNNQTVDLGLCSWISLLSRCCPSPQDCFWGFSFPGLWESRIQSAHRVELLGTLVSKVSKFTRRLPTHPPGSAFLGNFVNLNVLQGTPRSICPRGK